MEDYGREVLLSRSYGSKERFNSYWHQVDEILSLGPRDVLEIGGGNDFLRRYLRSRDIHVTDVDISKDFAPDIVGDVRALPLDDDQFDVCVCFEVLEHMPYEDFKRSLSEMRRCSKEWVLISVPDITTVYRIFWDLPLIGRFQLMVPKKMQKLKEHDKDEEYHYWSIGEVGHSLREIKEDIQSTGLEVVRTYRVFENPFHRFFILKKKGDK